MKYHLLIYNITHFKRKWIKFNPLKLILKPCQVFIMINNHKAVWHYLVFSQNLHSFPKFLLFKFINIYLFVWFKVSFFLYSYYKYSAKIKIWKLDITILGLTLGSLAFPFRHVFLFSSKYPLLIRLKNRQVK